MYVYYFKSFNGFFASLISIVELDIVEVFLWKQTDENSVIFSQKFLKKNAV